MNRQFSRRGRIGLDGLDALAACARADVDAARDMATWQNRNVWLTPGSLCSMTFPVMLELQAGGDDALAVLDDGYFNVVLGVGLRVLRDQGEAEDIL